MIGDAFALLLVLAALYAFECFSWPPADTPVFHSAWSRTWRMTTPAALLVRLRRGVFFSNPIPLGLTARGGRWPISISPVGVLGWIAHASNPGTRGEQTGEFVRFENLRSARNDGCALLVNGRYFALAATPAEARRLINLLREIRDLPEASRATLIAQALARHSDLSLAGQAISALRSETPALRAMCVLLFLTCFVATPLAFYSLGFLLTWKWLLGIAAFWWVQILWLFWAAHRRTQPGAGPPFDTLSTMVLMPVAAIRAVDFLWSEPLGGFHPATIGAHLLRESELVEHLGRIARDFAHPIPGSPGGSDSDAADCEAWFRPRFAAACLAPFEAGGAIRTSVRPAETDPGALSYCPRCLDQFRVPAGACHSCGGVDLQPLRKPETVPAS